MPVADRLAAAHVARCLGGARKDRDRDAARTVDARKGPCRDRIPGTPGIVLGAPCRAQGQGRQFAAGHAHAGKAGEGTRGSAAPARCGRACCGAKRRARPPLMLQAARRTGSRRPPGPQTFSPGARRGRSWPAIPRRPANAAKAHGRRGRAGRRRNRKARVVGDKGRPDRTRRSRPAWRSRQPLLRRRRERRSVGRRSGRCTTWLARPWRRAGVAAPLHRVARAGLVLRRDAVDGNSRRKPPPLPRSSDSLAARNRDTGRTVTIS